MLFKLLIGFDVLSFPEYLAKTQSIKVALTTEPAVTLIPDPWPAPYPSRVALTTAFTEFETAYDASHDGGRTALDARDQKRAILTQLLKDAAPYFESVAKAANDITLLDITGYDRRMPSGPLPQPPAAPDLKLSRGRVSGLLIAKASRPEGTILLETQRCTGDPSVEGNWNGTVQSSSSIHIELPGCTPGQLYYARTRAIGTGGPGPWSDVANLMAT